MTLPTSRTITIDDMGTYRTSVVIENMALRGASRAIDNVIVDTGSEYTWVPRDVLACLGITPERRQRFVVADGRAIEREMGFALVHAGGAFAPDFVVFAEPGDMVLLG